jgi:hypothetical protein
MNEQRSNFEEVKARARDARDLVEDRAFLEAVATLRKQWFGELMNPSLADRDQIFGLVQLLRALEAIPQRLASTMRDVEFAPRGNHARGN